MAQSNKSRIVIWTIVGILVVAAVIFLIIARKSAPTALPFTADNAAKYAEKATKRLDGLAEDATALRAQFGTDPAFAKFDTAMEKARADLQEMQSLTDEKALKAKKDEVEGYRFDMNKILVGFRKQTK